MRSNGSEHPCFNASARHRAGRIHLPVARNCNIKCAYCNPRQDCVHESGPGAASEVMSPAEAVERVEMAVAMDPAIKVIGIAGPGDPLANVETLETLQRIRKHPRLRSLELCLSTNGLALPRRLPDLVESGVTHLTVTINAVDPQIGARLCRAVLDDEAGTLRGVAAAELLLERQLRGVKAAVEAGLIVKVNSVLVPGINDRHITDVANVASRSGAVLFNVMPLIPRAAFAEMEPPSARQMSEARNAVEQILPVMRHCRQCRADASGLLGEEGKGCGAESKSRPGAAGAPTRVAVATSGNGLVDRHFGHVSAFDIYEVEGEAVSRVGERRVEQYCQGPSDCDPEDRLAPVIETLAGCRLVLCTSIGPEPARRLAAAGIDVRQIFGPVEQAVSLAAAAHRSGAGLRRRPMPLRSGAGECDDRRYDTA